MLFEDADTRAHSLFTTETCRVDLQFRNQKKFQIRQLILIGMIEECVCGILITVPHFQVIMQIENGTAFEKPALVLIHEERCRFCLMHGCRNSRQELFFVLTDPMPESATESPPECVVCVLLLGFESVFAVLPPTG